MHESDRGILSHDKLTVCNRNDISFGVRRYISLGIRVVRGGFAEALLDNNIMEHLSLRSLKPIILNLRGLCYAAVPKSYCVASTLLLLGFVRRIPEFPDFILQNDDSMPTVTRTPNESVIVSHGP